MSRVCVSVYKLSGVLWSVVIFFFLPFTSYQRSTKTHQMVLGFGGKADYQWLWGSNSTNLKILWTFSCSLSSSNKAHTTQQNWPASRNRMMATEIQCWLHHLIKKETTPPLVFTLPFSPQIKHSNLKRALFKHWHLINDSDFLHNLFPAPPLLAFKRQKT